MVKYDLMIIDKDSHVRKVDDVEDSTLPRRGEAYQITEGGTKTTYTVQVIKRRATLKKSGKLEIITDKPQVIIKDIR